MKISMKQICDNYNPDIDKPDAPSRVFNVQLHLCKNKKHEKEKVIGCHDCINENINIAKRSELEQL